MTDEFFSISQLNQLIKDVVNSGFPAPVWVCGEIQGFDRNREKNHIFFELVEKDKVSHEVTAKISVVLFAARKSLVDDVLKRSGSPFVIKDDIEVKFLCKVDFYAPHGAMRLSVENIDPIYTLGKIAQEKQKLIALLKSKGTLDQNKKLELPPVPLNIGLITAYDSAAYNDFISELRKSGYAFRVRVRHTTMQGKKSEIDVCKALRELKQISDLDLIVITRGGGSIADLSCFDSQMIAENIAASPLPVLSGIGHEINTTITDMAAHTYAKTPTAIAQFIVYRVQAFLQTMDEHQERLIDFMEDKLALEKQRLKEAAINLHNGTLGYLREHNEEILLMKQVLKQQPVLQLKALGKELTNQQDILKRTIRQRLENDQNKLKNYRKMIDMVHPQNTLKRGFSITRDKTGKVIKSIKEVAPAQVLMTELVDGSLESQVKERLKKSHANELDLFK